MLSEFVHRYAVEEATITLIDVLQNEHALLEFDCVDWQVVAIPLELRTWITLCLALDLQRLTGRADHLWWWMFSDGRRKTRRLYCSERTKQFYRRLRKSDGLSSVTMVMCSQYVHSFRSCSMARKSLKWQTTWNWRTSRIGEMYNTKRATCTPPCLLRNSMHQADLLGVITSCHPSTITATQSG